MWKVFAFIFVVTTGQMEFKSSKETYPTREACEAVIAQRLTELKSIFDMMNMEVEVGGKCDIDGLPV